MYWCLYVREERDYKRFVSAMAWHFLLSKMLIESLPIVVTRVVLVELEVTETGMPETFVELLFPSRGTRSLLRGEN